MSKLKIAALAGDGIGPEVMREAIKVLRAIEKKFSIHIEINEATVGWAGIDAAGKAPVATPSAQRYRGEPSQARCQGMSRRMIIDYDDFGEAAPHG